MFLTKLRIGVGAALASVMVAFGVLAAWPTEAPGQQAKGKSPKPVAKTPDSTPARSGADGPKPAVGPDEKLVQGYWKAERCELPPKVMANAETAKQIAEVTRYTWLLVVDDSWWVVTGNRAERHRVTLTPQRNPKWIDSPTRKAGELTITGLRGIYRMPDADTLELCFGEGGKRIRPAEFVVDDDIDSSVVRFKRHALPEVPADHRPAREQLYGAWRQKDADVKNEPAASDPVVFTPHFAFLPEGPHWAAYAYDLDPEKDPAWIDLNPAVADIPAADLPKPIYGVYGRRGPNDSILTLALSEGAKRVARPLEFVADKEAKVRVLNLVRETDPPREKVIREVAPSPQPVPEDAKRFRVPSGGLSLRGVARVTLGSAERWAEIYSLNSQFRPDDRLPAGTELRLPADARVPK
jgi:uncharacterized protein (TIGR03067 family)